MQKLLSEVIPQLQGLTRAYFEGGQVTLPQAISLACHQVGIPEVDDQLFIMLAMPVLTALMNKNYAEKHISLDVAIDQASRQSGFYLSPLQKQRILRAASSVVAGTSKPSTEIKVEAVSDKEFAEATAIDKINADVTRKEGVSH